MTMPPEGFSSESKESHSTQHHVAPDGVGSTSPLQQVPHQNLAGWNLVPLTVQIGAQGSRAISGDALEDPQGLPTVSDIRLVLDQHKAVAAYAQGPAYLQVAVLVDDAGRTAAVGEDGSVVTGDAMEDLAASVQRMTGQSVEALHPQLRRVLVLHVDAPDLPMVAAATQVGFSAVSHQGWSVVIPDDENAWWALRTGFTGAGVALASDGSTRSLEVLLGCSDPAGYTNLEHADAVCGLAWGPQWTAVSDDGDATAAGRLTREVVDMCGTRTTDVHSESVASVFDLDPVEAKRLANYVQGESTPLVLESVMQLLGLPVLAAKIVEGTKALEDIEGLERVEAGSESLAAVQALTRVPTTKGLGSRLQRTVLQRPELLLAVAGAEVVAGSGLAVLARRGGRASVALGALSAVVLTDAAGMTAWYSAAKRRKTKNPKNN